MNYIEKMENLLDSLDTGGSKFEIRVGDEFLRVVDSKWEPDFVTEGFYEDNLEDYISRYFDRDLKEYTINKDKTIRVLEDHIIHSMYGIFINCSPAKEPTRTKAYKGFIATLKDNKGKIEFTNSLFDIAEYFYSVTRTHSIKKEVNDIHRKNIFQILCLMEKNNAKRKKNSN